MPQTPLGQLQRSSKGRFLYGRPANYRLRPCLAELPVTYVNSKLHDQLVTAVPTDGDAPLAVTYTALNTNYATFPVADQWLHWPTTNNQTTDRVKTGGYIFQGAARFYPRVNNGTAIKAVNTPTWDIDFGDGTSTGETAAFDTVIVKTYTEGKHYFPDVTLIDALGREQIDTEFEINAHVRVTSITSEEAFGTILLIHTLAVPSIATAEAFETPTLVHVLGAVGDIATGETVSTDAVVSKV